MKQSIIFLLIIFLTGAYLVQVKNRSVISTCEDLLAINDEENGKFAISANIDCSTTKMSPIGGEGKAFRGTLEGSGHIVSGIRINSSKKKVGLFSVGERAVIKNLIFEDFQVKSNANSVGLIFGEAREVLIQNVTLRSSKQKPFRSISSINDKQKKENKIRGEGERKLISKIK